MHTEFVDWWARAGLGVMWAEEWLEVLEQPRVGLEVPLKRENLLQLWYSRLERRGQEPLVMVLLELQRGQELEQGLPEGLM